MVSLVPPGSGLERAIRQRSHTRRPPLGQPQLNVPRKRSHPRGRPLQPRFPKEHHHRRAADDSLCGTRPQSKCVCCFVLLVPTRMLYRVPRVSPGVTAPILRSLPSQTTPGPPSSLQTTPDSPVLLSGGQSGVQYLLGLIRGERREGKESPCRPQWLRWIAHPPDA